MKYEIGKKVSLKDGRDATVVDYDDKNWILEDCNGHQSLVAKDSIDYNNDDYDDEELNEIKNATSDKGRRLMYLMGLAVGAINDEILVSLRANGLKNGKDFESDSHSGWTNVNFLRDKELADKIFDDTREAVIEKCNNAIVEGSRPDFDEFPEVYELLGIREKHFFDSKVEDTEEGDFTPEEMLDYLCRIDHNFSLTWSEWVDSIISMLKSSDKSNLEEYIDMYGTNQKKNEAIMEFVKANPKFNWNSVRENYDN